MVRVKWIHVYWKHTLETSFAFGNKKCVLETYIGYWKHNMDIGNIRIRFETYELDLKHILDIWNITFVRKHILLEYILETYNETPLAGSHVKYTIQGLMHNNIMRKLYYLWLKVYDHIFYEYEDNLKKAQGKLQEFRSFQNKG